MHNNLSIKRGMSLSPAIGWAVQREGRSDRFGFMRKVRTAPRMKVRGIATVRRLPLVTNMFVLADETWIKDSR